MATTLQFRRYDTSTISGLAGESGELFINLDNGRIHVQDGNTNGGIQLALKSEVDGKTDIGHQHDISQIISLSTELNAKANDSDVVKLTGNQTIQGFKTFDADQFTVEAGGDVSLHINNTNFRYKIGDTVVANKGHHIDIDDNVQERISFKKGVDELGYFDESGLTIQGDLSQQKSGGSVDSYIVYNTISGSSTGQLYLDGASTKISVPENSVVTYNVRVTVVYVDAYGEINNSAFFHRIVMVGRDTVNGTTDKSGVTTVTPDIGSLVESGLWSLSVQSNNSDNTFEIEFTNDTVNDVEVIANVEAVRVSF